MLFGINIVVEILKYLIYTNVMIESDRTNVAVLIHTLLEAETKWLKRGKYNDEKNKRKKEKRKTSTQIYIIKIYNFFPI